MTQAAQRAVDTIIAQVLDRTVSLGDERADALDLIGDAVKGRAHELRAAKIEAACSRCNDTGYLTREGDAATKEQISEAKTLPNDEAARVPVLPGGLNTTT